MLKKLTTTIALAAAAFTMPMAAQTTSPRDAEMMQVMGSMFGAAEPLSAEQEARIPKAEMVVGKIFPPGTYAKMMDETMRPMMDGMMGAMLQMPAAELANLTGLLPEELEATGDGTVSEAMAIMDPAYEERSKRIMNVSIGLITDLMNQIEPSYRAGLTRAYAVRFSEAELSELITFFATPTGGHYAAESMLIYTDPQVMSAMNEMMPAMLEMLPAMMTNMTEATADLPEARSYSQLSEEEQVRLAAILQVSRAELAEIEPAEDAYDDTYEGSEEDGEDATEVAAE